jgi:hypothetical protein
MRATVKTHQLSLMSFPSSTESSLSSSYNFSLPPHYHEKPTMRLLPNEDTLQQVQQMAVHTTNIIRAVSMFHSDDMRNNSHKECKRKGQVLHITVQVFHNNTKAGDASPNILDLLPRAVYGCVLITGQHNQAPQTFAIGQIIVHGIVQVHGDDVSMHPLHNPKANSSTMSSTVDVDQPLAIRNPEIPEAPFEELDFLRPLRPVTPYVLYLGSPLPDFNYHPCMPIPEFVKELGVILGDDWLCNIEGLLLVHPYTIPGLGGRMVEAPFYKYDFLSDYPELLLSQGHNCL